MSKDVIYTNGVIAAEEKFLLKEKIGRLAEATAEDAFRILTESGFGGGAETATDWHDFELLIEKEEASLDEFIREYAPSRAEAEYLLSPRDFHNAKALLKAAYLHVSAEKMLVSEGMYPIERLSAAVSEAMENGKCSLENAELKAAIETASSLLRADEGEETIGTEVSHVSVVSGAEIGEIFEKQLFRHLEKTVGGNSDLKKLLIAKADMTNILTYFRSEDAQRAERAYLTGGKLKKQELAEVAFGVDSGFGTVSAFGKGGKYLKDYSDFIKTCEEAKETGAPFTEAEKIAASCEADLYAAKRYDLAGRQPFLYYVFRRRAENANVRIVFVCLSAGMKETEIKRRLRAF